MSLTELFDEPEETAVVGDLDAFIAYVESGQAWHDWQGICAASRKQRKQIDYFLQRRIRTREPIVSPDHRQP